MAISEGGAWFLGGVGDACKKRSGEIMKAILKSNGPSFLTSHSRAKTPPEEIQAGGFGYF